MSLFSQPGKKQENLVWKLRGKTENCARNNGWISHVEANIDIQEYGQFLLLHYLSFTLLGESSDQHPVLDL